MEKLKITRTRKKDNFVDSTCLAALAGVLNLQLLLSNKLGTTYNQLKEFLTENGIPIAELFAANGIEIKYPNRYAEALMEILKSDSADIIEKVYQLAESLLPEIVMDPSISLLTPTERCFWFLERNMRPIDMDPEKLPANWDKIDRDYHRTTTIHTQDIPGVSQVIGVSINWILFGWEESPSEIYSSNPVIEKLITCTGFVSEQNAKNLVEYARRVSDENK